MFMLLIEGIHLLADFPVYVGRCHNGNLISICHRLVISVMKACVEIHAILPDISECDVRTEAKILVFHFSSS